jgi:hypothetical protein
MYSTGFHYGICCAVELQVCRGLLRSIIGWQGLNKFNVTFLMDEFFFKLILHHSDKFDSLSCTPKW